MLLRFDSNSLGNNIRPIMQALCVSVVAELVNKGLIDSLQVYLYVILCFIHILGQSFFAV